jgi:hypothetical protein
MKNIRITLMHFDTSTIINMKISYMCTYAKMLRLLRDPTGALHLEPTVGLLPPIRLRPSLPFEES